MSQHFTHTPIPLMAILADADRYWGARNQIKVAVLPKLEVTDYFKKKGSTSLSIDGINFKMQLPCKNNQITLTVSGISQNISQNNEQFRWSSGFSFLDDEVMEGNSPPQSVTDPNLIVKLKRAVYNSIGAKQDDDLFLAILCRDNQGHGGVGSPYVFFCSGRFLNAGNIPQTNVVLLSEIVANDTGGGGDGSIAGARIPRLA